VHACIDFFQAPQPILTTDYLARRSRKPNETKPRQFLQEAAESAEKKPDQKDRSPRPLRPPVNIPQFECLVSDSI
jgi:Tfp pilus assembly protein PilP